MSRDGDEVRRKVKPGIGTGKEPRKEATDRRVRANARKEALAKAQQITRDAGTSAAKAVLRVASSQPAKRVKAYTTALHRRARSWGNREQIKARLAESWAWAKSQGTDTAVHLQGWANALLTTEVAKDLAYWTADKFNKNFDKYDTAIDKVYNAGEGGYSAIHHLVDGNHTLLGAIRAAREVQGDDSVFAVVANAVEHLVRDGASVSGVNPVYNLTGEQLDRLHGFADQFGMSERSVNDIQLLNAPEVLGAFFAVVPVCFGWSKLGAERFADIAGRAGVAALVSANPLLGLIALVSMARSFNLLLSQEEGAFTEAAFKGGLGAVQNGVVYAASAAIGGHVMIGIIVGLVVAYAIQRYASSDMTHEQMLTYITQIYATRILPSISASSEASFALFCRLQETLQFDQTAEADA